MTTKTHQAAPARLTRWMRSNLSMQGYEALSDGERRELGLALRLSPALCLTGMALGVVLESPAIVLAMAATAFLGGFVTAKHPFDLIWDHRLRRIADGPPLPPSPPPRRFACQLASVWLVGIAAALLAGSETIAWALGVPLLAVAAIVATTNWCLPSLVYGLIRHPQARGGTV